MRFDFSLLRLPIVSGSARDLSFTKQGNYSRLLSSSIVIALNSGTKVHLKLDIVDAILSSRASIKPFGQGDFGPLYICKGCANKLASASSRGTGQ